MRGFLASRIIDQTVALNLEKAALPSTGRGWHKDIHWSAGRALHT
jgi:hypothetical protein